MLANGIAVVQLNPYTSDTWEWYTPDLPAGSGLDQPYLQVLFDMMHNGSYANLGKGVLDVSKLIVAGYSSGAQMASCTQHPPGPSPRAHSSVVRLVTHYPVVSVLLGWAETAQG